MFYGGMVKDLEDDRLPVARRRSIFFPLLNGNNCILINFVEILTPLTDYRSPTVPLRRRFYIR